MKRILAIALIFLFPLSGYCLSDQDVFNLLSKTSKKIELPLHVYIVPLHKDKKWSYGAYDGKAAACFIISVFWKYIWTIEEC